MGKIVGGLSCGKITYSPANGQTGARLSHLDREKSGIFGRKPPLIWQNPPFFLRFSGRIVRAPRRSFFFSPFLLFFRRSLVGAFVVSRSDIPFFVAMAAQVRETLAKASRCSPDARLGRGAKRWDDEGSVLKTGDRRGNLPLCFAGTHGSDECLPLGWLDVARYCEFCGAVCRQRRVCGGEDRRRIATARAVREAARSDFSKTRQKVIFCKLQFSK